jgi:hypothetical protein
MVIFHSYVSLPEGMNGDNIMIIIINIIHRYNIYIYIYQHD